MLSSDMHPPAISRTQQYKKITKPLLERKRRARINRCLDELKELMVGALEAEGENISKLEKADILELTVRHLHRLQRPRDSVEDAQRYQAGFGQCAAEACQFLLSLPGVDTRVGHNLIKHLGACLSNNGPLSIQVPNLNRLSYSPPVSPLTPQTIQPSTPNNVIKPKVISSAEILSSTPSVQDLSQPMTGLLMQVPTQNTRSVLRNSILERRKTILTMPSNNEVPKQHIISEQNPSGSVSSSGDGFKCNRKSLAATVIQKTDRPNIIIDNRQNKDGACVARKEDEEEEIDIENVEEENMWRPW